MKRKRTIPNFNFALALSLAVGSFAHAFFLSGGLSAQVLQDLPDVAQGISVEQKLGESLPMEVPFEDDKNRLVRIRDLFREGRPVLLSFNYSDCPQLCVIQLGNLAAALQHIDLIPGRDFEIVSVSLDPTEQSAKLAETKKNYVTAYGNLDSADGWHFLRGDKENIRKLADACGFNYKYVPESKIYSHPAAFIFCTADGRIARYLDGLDGTLERSLQPALIEAGQGKIGSMADKVLYFAGCYVFDPATGKYSMSAVRLLRLAAGATVVVLVIGIAPYWIRRNQGSVKTATDKNRSPEETSNPTDV